MTDTTPYQYLIPQGTVVADTSGTLAEVQGEWQQAFGADLIVTPDTPQGVMITAEALARDNVQNNNAALANQINPNVAGGVFLDAIGLLTGIQRDPETPTIVTGVTLTGAPGIISAGAQAKTTAGDIFELTQSVVIPSSGTVTGTFQSVESGPIPCAENTLTTIVTGVIGWETINNGIGSSTTLGATTQSDQAFRAYRLNTLAFQGLSLNEAITSALYAVPGVKSLSFLENYHSAPMGMIVAVTGGTTLSGTVWAMSTTVGTSSGTNILTVGTDAINFTENGQTVPSVNPWPTAAFSTTGNITLSGLGTQTGGDWGSALTAGTLVLVKNQTTASQNGVYLAESGAWQRQVYNTTGSQILASNSGISMLANSVYACVDGGTALDVASALLENKSSGSAWNGGTTTNIVEPSIGQSYAVKYDVPTAIDILITVNVSGATEAQVIQAIMDYQNGTVTDPSGNPSNLTGFQVGQSVSVFELGAAIVTENPGCYVSALTIAVNGGSPVYSTNPITIGLNQIAATNDGLITVNITG